MKTSYFAKSGNHVNSVSIALYPPKWYTGVCYPGLAPPDHLLKLWKEGKIDEEGYEEIYSRRVLWHLRPHKIIEDLGQDAILLCWEKSEKFCHRHIVARWLMANADITVEEYV
jgi:hypothetical protein